MKNKLFKPIIMVKIIIVLLLVSFGQLQAESIAQTVSIKKKNSSITDVFREIKKQTGYTVLCKSDIINSTPRMDVNLAAVGLEQALESVLVPNGLTYVIDGKSIVVRMGKHASKKVESPSTAANTVAIQQVVEGVVTDGQGQMLSGVSVTIKGTNISTVTDQKGHYRITTSRGSVLTFSMLGFERKEVEVNSTAINVSLRMVEADLEEVVITGYGTFKKSEYTGSASTIRTDKMADIPAVDFSTMLQGNAPGVQVNSLSGQPGGAVDIKIRGMGSINASNKPLFVIDGVPVMSGNIASSSSNNGGFDVMSTLNNSDIEQITVIKDAAAASLYGSRAAGGVILITTKSGKAGKPVFNLKADYGISSQATDFREVMDGAQRR